MIIEPKFEKSDEIQDIPDDDIGQLRNYFINKEGHLVDEIRIYKVDL